MKPLASMASCALAAALAACAGSAVERSAPPPAVAPVPELKPGVPAGYLGRALPDSLALVPPPPAAGSPAFAQDEAIHAAAQKLRDGPRGALATSDADLHFPHAPGAFDCALGTSITQEATPRLYLLMQRTMVDAGIATYRAKDHYKRERPFVHYNEGTCAPGDEAALRNDGSYPSGHTSIGWAWGLILVEIAPDRADALLARARAFGESRLVCNAHWQSDVLAGRTVAAAAVARLHADPTFVADVAAAREEVQRAAPIDPSKCTGEAALDAPIAGVL
ncbi:phosphatase PAP2 family protein [Lysobacter sp. KIS68-7]|uniref:acid phosphatase n=1 Tax=Lysobacter sp. KIS68-7 TaxID=2904252 RepID=UPI001E556F90|nr:phosphatase PAP2 family protein [Lysobacter sp. KIS68-7]UHQ20187.1 phosphatase PAP2 family protein [Lysobacter sp. KIS68-7]